MKRAAVLLPVLLVAACGGSSSTGPHTIVLDDSIGPVRLLEKQTDVERSLGKGTKVFDDKQQGHLVRYPRLGLEVAYAPGPKGEAVFVILTKSGRYRTGDGVGVGSSLEQVKRIKGIECFNGGSNCQHGNTHNKPGTGFAFRGGKVWRIVITILD